MSDSNSSRMDAQAFDNFVIARGKQLRALDQPPFSRKEWLERRPRLRAAVLQAMGTLPDDTCLLDPRMLGELKRPGYRIEKLIFQSRPDVWVTATAYVPENVQGKLPAVLCVHGHWPWGRRDPVVQARCVGLVRLGFFVLAVDAFGAGERAPEPGRGTYHGALSGATLWPAGLTLLGCQFYDNRRAVDYLRSRPEVDGDRLGITGASGGGNQTMYAGALDERFRAVVPVCSVGSYQAYLRAACCVCEVLPGALRFTEEGDVLGLTAPRALMVVSATQDSFQFSVGEAARSLDRARIIYRFMEAPEKVRHSTFDSPHAYNQAMREAMYGWMTRWLKNEGDGSPITEREQILEKPEDLSCFADRPRPKLFLFPPTLAAREARVLLGRLTQRLPDHVEDWQATAAYLRGLLARDVFGGLPDRPRPSAQFGRPLVADGVATTDLELKTESGLSLPAVMKSRVQQTARQPVCVLLHLKGKSEAISQPLAAALLARGWTVVAPELRATGELRPTGDTIHGAIGHNAAEHALWIGRPLLGQWVFDLLCLVDWLGLQPTFDPRRLALVGFDQAGIVALCAAGQSEDRVTAAAALNTTTSFITETAYPDGWHMGLLAPGLLRAGDVPQWAALVAPRPLLLIDGTTTPGRKLTERYLREAYAFTGHVYGLHGAAPRLTIAEGAPVDELVAKLER
jgi:dienelactone hydrolase